jgi:2-oxoglutarate ferredoxin oxidoreductase subunit delta
MQKSVPRVKGSTKGMVLVNEERCKGCGLCVEVCPTGALGLSEKRNSSGYRVVAFLPEKGCKVCGFCYLICPDAALEVWRRR